MVTKVVVVGSLATCAKVVAMCVVHGGYASVVLFPSFQVVTSGVENHEWTSSVVIVVVVVVERVMIFRAELNMSSTRFFSLVVVEVTNVGTILTGGVTSPEVVVRVLCVVKMDKTETSLL